MTLSKDWEILSDIVLNSKFRQKQLLTEDLFIGYCKERDLNIKKETLMYLNKIDLFKPILILDAISGISLNYTSLQYYYKNGAILSPKKNDTQDKGTTNIYHPYQLLLLKIILDRFSFYIQPPFTLINKAETAKLVKSAIKANKTRIKSFIKTDLRFYLKLFKLLLSTEENYLPSITKIFSCNGLEETDCPHWCKYHNKFKPITIIKNLKLSEHFIKEAYERLDIIVRFLDPLYEWHSLIRYFPKRKRDCLKGKALLAQLYYEALDILRAISHDLPHQPQLQGNYEEEAQWFKKTLGKEINYERYDVLEYLLNIYGINPSPRVLVYVEGETEYAVINKLLEGHNIEIENVGIKLDNLHGIDGFNYKRLTHHLEYLIKNKTDCFFILDPEGNVKKQANMLINKFPNLKDKLFIWERDFERDNFTKKEIANGLSDYSRKFDLPLPILFSENDIAKAKTLRSLYCGKRNNCPKKLTCAYSSTKISKCLVNKCGHDKLNKPKLGLLMTSTYLLAKKPKKNHPSMKKGIINILNQILSHASSRAIYDRH